MMIQFYKKENNLQLVYENKRNNQFYKAKDRLIYNLNKILLFNKQFKFISNVNQNQINKLIFRKLFIFLITNAYNSIKRPTIREIRFNFLKIQQILRIKLKQLNIKINYYKKL